MKPEISRNLSCQPKPELPIVWADLFTGVRSDASRFIPADISAAEITEIQAVISDRVGMKACWREILKRDGWTDQLFDDWWESSSEKKFEQQMQNLSNRKCDNADLQIMAKLRFFILGLLCGDVGFALGCLIGIAVYLAQS